jgi:predicted DNA-binding WGR domain protein
MVNIANQALSPMIHLQAVDPTRNIARDYQIEVSLDLFGHWIIALHWGRISTRGQNRLISFDKQCDAARFVKRTLSRRASARKRFGTVYRIII